MKITVVESGTLQLDGGAMFGVVPWQLWRRLNPPDERNRCTWALRCLLIEAGDRKILADTGIGDKQDAKFQGHFGVGQSGVVEALAAVGHEADSITDVLLTHLHFDHAGGAVRKSEAGKLVPAFPNATYWSNELHYNWALFPNAREKASFLPENFEPLKAAGVLKFIDVQKDDLEWLDGISIRFVYGHTEAMMLPIFRHQDKTAIFCVDVIPSSFHIGMPYVMAYDVRPLITLEEKGRILEEAVSGRQHLAFAHDPHTPCINVFRSDNGRIEKGEAVNLESLFTF